MLDWVRVLVDPTRPGLRATWAGWDRGSGTPSRPGPDSPTGLDELVAYVAYEENGMPLIMTIIVAEWTGGTIVVATITLSFDVEGPRWHGHVTFGL